jgi:hypothetical protein
MASRLRRPDFIDLLVTTANDDNDGWPTMGED